MKFSSSIASRNAINYAIFTSSGVGATSGLGVSIARTISALSSRSSTEGTQSAEQILSYTHTISIEISSKESVALWKGESTWDTQDLNILIGIIPALQLILSDLPADKTVRAEVSEVKDTHIDNYFRLICKDAWFTCPALPYRIYFAERSQSIGGPKTPVGINNPNALAAYVYLVQTAEYALPGGDERAWKNPLEISLWKNVTLGGQYYIGPSKKAVNVIIELVGKSDGYYVEMCKIADDKEYSEFNLRLRKWREALY